MAERVLRARFEGDASGLKRMAQEGKQAIDSVVGAQEKGSREMAAAVEQAERGMVAAVQSGTQRRIATIQRETNEAIQAIEKLPAAREAKEREIARIVEANAKRTSDILLQEIRKQEQAHREVSEGMGAQSGAAMSLTRSLAGLVAAYVSLQSVIGMAGKGLAGNADLQQAELTFEVLYRDAGRAKDKIEELYEFSSKTPFEFTPVKEAALALETFGLNSSDYLRDAGDLAAAFGAEISEVARVFGRINSGDFGEAFERMRDFGISREMLEGEGLVFDKSGSYQGSVDQALTAVQNIIREKFGGMMERQAAIANGQMSTLADNFQTILNSVMAPSFETLTGVVAELNASLDGAFGDEMQANVRVLGDIVNGIAVASLALGKAIGETLDEMMAPLRWMRDTSAALGKGAGERDVAKSLVLSSGINPNRAQHYAKLVGQGEDLRNISRDFLVRTWDERSVQEDLGKIAVAISKARMIVDGTIQYTNYEPFGPPLPPGGVNTRTTTTGSAPTAKALDGHQLLTALHKSGSLPDAEYLAKLNVELGKVVKNSSDYFAILDKISTIEARPSWALPDKTRDGQYFFPGGGPEQYFGPGYGKDLVAFEGREEKRVEDLGARIEREATAYAKRQNEVNEKARKDANDLAKEADKSLRSGLEAGVSAFLDGGIGNLGEATYSLSKDAFGKALVDGVMGSGLKDVLGGLGTSIGDPLKAGIAAVVLGVMQIKDAFDDIGEHTRKLEDLQKRYGNPYSSGSTGTLMDLTKEYAAYSREAERQAPGWLLWGGGYNEAIKGKVATYDSLIPKVASSAFGEVWDGKDALEADSLAEALRMTDTAARDFASAMGMTEAQAYALSAAEREKMQALYDATQATKDFAGSLSSYGGLMKSLDWRERLGGGEATAQDLWQTGMAATGGQLDIGKISQDDAIRLAELYGLMQYGDPESTSGGQHVGPVGGERKSIRQQIVEILGDYDPGKDNEGRDQLPILLEQMVLPLLAQMRDLTGGGQTQSIGSLSNPDTALQVDAPVNRVNNFNNQVVINTYAITGDKASFRDLVIDIMSEANTIQGQSV